jgi:hypothetical protein
MFPTARSPQANQGATRRLFLKVNSQQVSAKRIQVVELSRAILPFAPEAYELWFGWDSISDLVGLLGIFESTSTLFGKLI